VSGQGAERLSQFQLDLASAFFALPESIGFLLAGGGALIAQGLVNRETDDLDFFADRAAGDVATASDALIGAAANAAGSLTSYVPVPNSAVSRSPDPRAFLTKPRSCTST